MARILVHAEGQTEETVVNEVLRPHLQRFGHTANARLIGNARQRGGICGWEVACDQTPPSSSRRWSITTPCRKAE